MSFGYAVGDVIAVLGLFERVVIELRSYKNAPAQFQQLGAEIDLLRSTFQHVLALNADDPTERQTLERIRAITMHCLQPLQALADKMKTKEPSLGHFRSTRSLKAIGTRLHWSLIAQKDVDELRKTILSELLAVNILLSVQQLGCIKQLSNHIRDNNSQLSTTIDARSRTIISQTSLILSLVKGMPGAITDLQSTTIAQAQQQAKRIETLDQRLSSTTAQLADLSIKASKTSTIIETYAKSMRGAARRLSSYMEDVKKLIVFLSMCSKEMLGNIGRNTQILLVIAGQMKRMVKAIEAIPLHLGLEIIRFDDGLGESWALPFQACGTWQSFCTLLKSVVFIPGKPGAARVEADKFFIKIASTGHRISPSTWEYMIKAGSHIEQTMIVDSTDCDDIDVCLGPRCHGTALKREEGESKYCPDCGRSVVSRKVTKHIAVFPQVNRTLWKEKADVDSNWNPWAQRNESLSMPLRPLGPIKVESLQSTGMSDEIRQFHRIQLDKPSQKFGSLGEVVNRRVSLKDHSGSHCIGFCFLLDAESGALEDAISQNSLDSLSAAITYLNEAISYDNTNAEAAYLLRRAYVQQTSYPEALNALQNAVGLSEGVISPAIWNTIGILYYAVNQFHDSFEALTRSVRTNPYVWEVWYNMGILYNASNSDSSHVLYALERALKLRPDLSELAERLERLKIPHDPLSDDRADYRKQGMCEIPLKGIQ